MNINNTFYTSNLSGEIMNISGENTNLINNQESNTDISSENVSSSISADTIPEDGQREPQFIPSQQFRNNDGPIELAFYYPQTQTNNMGSFFQQFQNLPMNISMRVIGDNDIINNQTRRTAILNRLGNILNNANIVIDNGTFDESQNQNTFENILQQSMTIDTKRPNILKETVYESWEKKKYEEMSDEFKKENTSCYITFEDYKNEDIVVNMSCGHSMSESAAKDWFRINYKCPFCMKKYDSRQMTDEEYQIYREELEKNKEDNPEEQEENEIVATSVDNEIPEDNETPENNNVPEPRMNNNLLQTIIQNTIYSNTYYDELYNRRQEELELQRTIERSMQIQ